MTDDLAQSLRAWRDRLDPTVAGLPRRDHGRTPGLRREEVATMAGISVNYLIRLEQGRARTPSTSVVASLVNALRLDTVEAEQLYRMAGLADPAGRVSGRRITPSIQRILERFDDVPLIVIDPAWTIVAANALADVCLGGDIVGQNSARRQFIGPQFVKRDAEEDERYERDIVGDLHRQLARHPDDTDMHAIIKELRTDSARFAELWAQRPAREHATSHKTLHHPATGTIHVDCDTLELVGTDLRVVVWTAPPGSPDAAALAQLRTATI